MRSHAPKKPKHILIVGIGSPHGNDRIGWEVIERLETVHPSAQTKSGNGLLLRKATAPIELLDWLEWDLTVHIIDSVIGDCPSIKRYRIVQKNGHLQCIPDPALGSPKTIANCSTAPLASLFETLQSKSSHQLDLISTLELASVLERLPSRLFLWTVAVEPMVTPFDLCPIAEARASECASQISDYVSSTS